MEFCEGESVHNYIERKLDNEPQDVFKHQMWNISWQDVAYLYRYVYNWHVMGEDK